MTRFLWNHRQQLRVFLRALGRKRPLLAERFCVFRLEEGTLHTAVDDVPRQHGVLAAVAEDEEAAVHAGFGHGGAPVLAVAFGGLYRRRHPAVAEREQRL